MIKQIEKYRAILDSYKFQIAIPEGIVQTLSEEQLIKILPEYDAWIIGDDPATARVLEAGKRLKIAVKWGVGIDNVDTLACNRLGIEFHNTPAMFNEEVADVAIGYMIMLARHLHTINRDVLWGIWSKPVGMSLRGKTVAVIGYGNIGRTLAEKLAVFGLKTKIYDPFFQGGIKTIDEAITDADFIILTCALTPSSYHCINSARISQMRQGTYLINVSRGGLIDENALINDGLATGRIAGIAMEVFEEEPAPMARREQLNKYNCIFGSHNASNTVEAVDRTNRKVFDILHRFLTPRDDESTFL